MRPIKETFDQFEVTTPIRFFEDDLGRQTNAAGIEIEFSVTQNEVKICTNGRVLILNHEEFEKMHLAYLRGLRIKQIAGESDE